MAATIGPSVLPPHPLDEAWSQYASAYDIVLNAERHANDRLRTNPLGREEKDNLVLSRVTGFLLIEFFNKRAFLTVEPCATLALEIVSPPAEGTTHDVVFRLGKHYCNYFIRLYRKSTKKYPTPSTHPSRPSFDDLGEMTSHFMEADGKGYKASKRRALARDGFRCMVTGRFDSSSLKKNSALRQKCDEQSSGISDILACHILSESTMQSIDGESAVPNKDAFAATVMDYFRHGSLARELFAKDGVHNLENLLSLTPDMHSQFDALGLWFEATEAPDCYNVCTYFEGLKGDLRRSGYLRQDGDRLLATFSSHHPDARLPDRRLLTLHAACARVAHLSGAAEAIDELEEDAQETRVLAFDGSSAHLLDYLMGPFAAVPGVV